MGLSSSAYRPPLHGRGFKTIPPFPVEPRRQVHPARSCCRCTRSRRRHRGARALFYPGFLLSPGISGDISKGRPGSRHGGQGLPLLPHCQEGKLQLGGAPGQRGGQGRGRTRPPHTCTSGLLRHLTLCTARFLSIFPACCAFPDLSLKCSLSPSLWVLYPCPSLCAREPQILDAAFLLPKRPADRTPVSV